METRDVIYSEHIQAGDFLTLDYPYVSKARTDNAHAVAIEAGNKGEQKKVLVKGVLKVQ